jgi:hypothetical protein
MQHLLIPNQQPPWKFTTVTQLTHIRNPVHTAHSSSTENTSPTTTGEETDFLYGVH